MTEPENNFELKREAEEKKSFRMDQVNNLLEMWQGSQNLCAVQKDCQA
jgi:hypothetical protein